MKKIKLLSKQKNSIDSAFVRLKSKENPPKEEIKKKEVSIINQQEEQGLTTHQEFKRGNPVLFGEDGSKTLKNLKWELFCNYYTEESELFGNGIYSYSKAYNIDAENDQKGYAVAGTCASKLLKKVEIMSRINYLLDKLVLNDSHIDKQLAFLITQNAQLQPKLGAIQEYNKLKNRIQDKLNNQTNVIVFGPGQVRHFRKRDEQD